MERKKVWKDFQTLVDARPDYRVWLYCEDPEEKVLRQELLERMSQLSQYATAVWRTPMPTEINDVLLFRSSLHIDQSIAFQNFVETLFENCLRQGSDENLNLLFSFLETYTALLEKELNWCKHPAG